MHVVNTWVTEWSPIKTRFDIFVIPQFDHRCDDLAKELAAAQPCQSHSLPGQICAENLEQKPTKNEPTPTIRSDIPNDIPRSLLGGGDEELGAAPRNC